MTAPNLHIVSFSVPYPVVHGGHFDLFFKIVALCNAGVKIHLHCFGERQEEELSKYCAAVYYYPRRKMVSPFTPYIVFSRRSRLLKQRLLADEAPILLEGVHSCGILTDKRFVRRRILLRLHNVEHLYYRKLFESPAHPLKKLYYLCESWLLKRFERKIAPLPDHIFAVSQKDIQTYSREFSPQSISFLPVFIGSYQPRFTGSAKGEYCLYHGNLAVAENEQAVRWLVDEVFTRLDVPLVVAGRSPSRSLTRELLRRSGVTLVADPNDSQLKDLMAEARCHVLPSFNATGVKLKLIQALRFGGHCITNRAGVEGSQLNTVCQVADTAPDFACLTASAFASPLSAGEVLARQRLMEQLFDDTAGATAIIRWLS